MAKRVGDILERPGVFAIVPVFCLPMIGSIISEEFQQLKEYDGPPNRHCFDGGNLGGLIELGHSERCTFIWGVKPFHKLEAIRRSKSHDQVVT